jgi:NAD(P)-dependent dehydrogenase (short-subunit alcohol dehydrogenase family)
MTSQRNILVTGSSRGIGKAILASLQGHNAVGHSTRGGGGLIAADLDQPGAAEALWNEALERLGGRIDVLVNNAGIAEERPFLEIEDDSWDRILATNLRGAFLMAQRVARAQVASGGGAIVHIASIDASGGDGPYASYNASKAGLLGLSRTMALELGPHGVRVNCVSPGFTHTEMTEVGVPPAAMEYLTTRFDRVPMRRLVRPEEIASACAFLASDDASAITGIDLTVDCGLTANWYILESIPADG